jgi:DNA-binding transcriptional MerR regulator
MKTKNKKMAGGLLIGLIVTAVGAVIATAQIDTATDQIITPILNEGKYGPEPFTYNLPEEQQAELEDLMATLREQNATRDETQAAITEKLDEYGILDTQLENEIEQTEQQLTILNRQKELRDQGYSWNEINTIIQEEFNLENMTCMGCGIEQSWGFRQGPCGGSHKFMPDDEFDQ